MELIKNPYLRLLFITVNVLLWGTLIIFGLRQLGHQQTYTQYNHPLLTSQTLYFVRLDSPDVSTQVLNNIEQFNNWIPYIEIEYRGDYWHYIKVHSKKPYKSQSFSSLADFLKTLKSSSLTVNIKNKELHQLPMLIKDLGTYPELKVIFTSETTAVLREARKRQPKWLYMASHSLVSRFQLMGAMFLETLTQVDEDLITIIHPKDFLPRLYSEMNKRKKLIVLDADVTPVSKLEANIKGYISSDFERLKLISQSEN